MKWCRWICCFFGLNTHTHICDRSPLHFYLTFFSRSASLSTCAYILPSFQRPHPFSVIFNWKRHFFITMNIINKNALRDIVTTTVASCSFYWHNGVGVCGTVRNKSEWKVKIYTLFRQTTSFFSVFFLDCCLSGAIGLFKLRHFYYVRFQLNAWTTFSLSLLFIDT